MLTRAGGGEGRQSLFFSRCFTLWFCILHFSSFKTLLEAELRPCCSALFTPAGIVVGDKSEPHQCFMRGNNGSDRQLHDIVSGLQIGPCFSGERVNPPLPWQRSCRDRLVLANLSSSRFDRLQPLCDGACDLFGVEQNRKSLWALTDGMG